MPWTIRNEARKSITGQASMMTHLGEFGFPPAPNRKAWQANRPHFKAAPRRRLHPGEARVRVLDRNARAPVTDHRGGVDPIAVDELANSTRSCRRSPRHCPRTYN